MWARDFWDNVYWAPVYWDKTGTAVAIATQVFSVVGDGADRYAVISRGDVRYRGQEGSEGRYMITSRD